MDSVKLWPETPHIFLLKICKAPKHVHIFPVLLLRFIAAYLFSQICAFFVLQQKKPP